MDVDTFLQHYGKKGMQWGVRKSGSSGKLTSGSKKAAPHPTKHMTNEQLKARVDRLRLEQQLSELSAPKKKAGHAYANEILKNSGKVAAGAVVSTAMGQILKRAFGNK